jgi:hypothetical protein
MATCGLPETAPETNWNMRSSLFGFVAGDAAHCALASLISGLDGVWWLDRNISVGIAQTGRRCGLYSTHD